MEVKYDITELLSSVDPSLLDYQGWVNVGMILKDNGFGVDTWDQWSRRDPARYHPNDCMKKWDGFRGTNNPVTVGTLVQMAREQGWTPPADEGYALDWDSTIGARDELVIVDKNWIEAREVHEPDAWDPVGEITSYLETLFEAAETVGYVMESWEKDGRYLPTKGAYDRTAGELIEALGRCGGDIGKVFGDHKPEAGAWIRFNPLDGRGVKNENVTDFRFALVESDTMPVEQQYAIIQELELPVALLVHSGGKSLHAIVRIDAANYEEYRKRVDYLYTVCEKNGLKIDSQNRNPSRLSRMPGVMRAGRKQYIAGRRMGKETYDQWHEWIEGVNDDLPEPESMAEAWDNLPELSPPLIENVLRQGHKMLLAGPSKAGKSFSLIELCIAIAEGKKWLAWRCAQGRVLYVNLELDRASCLHRFRDVYKALGLEPNNLKNIDIWNLRGKALPMDKLAPKLIRRAAKRGYIAIVIDPIYKVITGDENSADQMANFCNQFDKVCTELGCAVIYCHHHSKGMQGQKRSMDRASGSGVFARDPDAMMDMIELEPTEALIEQEGNKAVIDVICQKLNLCGPENWEDKISQDDMCNASKLLAACQKGLLSSVMCKVVEEEAGAAREAVKRRSAWRIEGTLREFERFKPVNLWFDYPVHHVDFVGSLADIEAEGKTEGWQKGSKSNHENAKKRKVDRNASLENAIASSDMDGKPTTKTVAEYLSIEAATVRKWIREHGGFYIDKNDGIIKRKGDDGHE